MNNCKKKKKKKNTAFCVIVIDIVSTQATLSCFKY